MISILDIGGNYGSLLAAFEKIGVGARMESRDATEANGSAYVLPGVGRADNAMAIMREHGWDELIINTTRPVLGICCGFHVMCRHSEEGDVEGMGIFPWRVLKRDRGRFGWTETECGWVYFCHLFQPNMSCLVETSYDWLAADKRDNFMGVQFHPEKSGRAGLEFLRKWVSHVSQ